MYACDEFALQERRAVRFTSVATWWRVAQPLGWSERTGEFVVRLVTAVVQAAAGRGAGAAPQFVVVIDPFLPGRVQRQAGASTFVPTDVTPSPL